MEKGKSMNLKILGTAAIALMLGVTAEAAESQGKVWDAYLRVPCYSGDKIPERVTAIAKTSRNTIVELNGFRETRDFNGVQYEAQWTEITEPGGSSDAGEYVIKKGSHHPPNYLEILHFPGANGDEGIYQLKVGRDSSFGGRPRLCLKRTMAVYLEEEFKREVQKFGPTAGFTQSPSN